MIEIIFLCILAVLIYKTPNELILFYNNILGKISTIVLLIIISNYCGLPCGIIFILIIVVISNKIENKNNNINLYDYRKLITNNKLLKVNDKDNNEIKNITKLNVNNINFFNKDRQINNYKSCEEIIQQPK